MRYTTILVKSVESLRDHLHKVKRHEQYVDTESTGLKFGSLLLSIQIYDHEYQECLFIPTDYFFEQGLAVRVIANVFKEFDLNVVCHNGKYDLGVLEKEGFDMSRITLVADTLILIHDADSNLEKNLEKRVKLDFGISKPKFKDIVGKNWDRIDWNSDVVYTKEEAEEKGKFTFNQFVKYSTDDAYWTCRLRQRYEPIIYEDDKLIAAYEKIDLPLVGVLNKMYQDGVNINKDVLSTMDGVLLSEIEKVEQHIFKDAGMVFNMNSPKQKAEVLYEHLGYPILGYTKTGNPSTDKDVLEKLADQGYSVCVKMKEYSVLQKLYSGYVNGIPNMLDYDGRLRGNLNAQGTKTYRFSSNNPNLQNQPNNKKFPVRQAFIPTSGWKMAVADYSQVELRVMAHVASDEKFMEYFNAGMDPHGMVASDLGITRNQAKVVNFGILYGMTKLGLGYALKIDPVDAQKIINKFENTYKGYYKWKKSMEKFFLHHKYGRSMFGRKVMTPYIHNSKFKYSQLRTGINSMIQGPAADIIKVAMINIHNEFKARGMEARMLLQVHDELAIEFPPHEEEEAYSILIDKMENAVPLRVPLVAEGVICNNWADMKGGDVPEYLKGIRNLNTAIFEPHLHLLYETN